jgi:hypothetical protein
MSQQLFIHEFSTGITPEGSKDKWVSKGFTGRYMNMTMPQIPVAVERAIANNGFAVAEGASSDQPAIIGRSIPDSDQPSGWAVVALVTRGEDEYGRSFGFHRYFLCPGSDRLWMLVEWLEMYRSTHGQYPIFNPYKLREPGKPSSWQEPAANPPVRGDMLPPAYEAIPCLIPSQSPITLVQINQLAQFKAETQQGQTSWAYNVEALEQPSRFLVIKPASAKAEQILRQPVIASARTVSASIEIDEQAIKGAVKGLINSAQVNADLVEVLISNIPVVEKALKTEAEATKYWEQLFDGQGAANGISQNIMTSQMVRLLAIRSIVLPERLSQYLTWLKVEKADQVSSSMQDSMQFQKQIRQVLSTWQMSKPDLYEILENNVFEGVKASLLELYRSGSRSQEKKGVSIEPMVWLLKSTQGLWGSLTLTVADSLGEMLQQIYDGSYQKAIADAQRTTAATASEGSKAGSRMTGGMSAVSKSQPSILLDESKGWQQEIWNRIMQHRNYPSRGIRRLSLFGDLFGTIENCYPLAACFYQLSLGEVPADIYSQNQQTFGQHPRPYGISIRRKPKKLERIVLTIQPYFLWISAASFIFILSYLVWLQLTGRNPMGQAITPKENTKDITENERPSNGVSCQEINRKIRDAITELNKSIPGNSKSTRLKAALKDFVKTKESIKKITESTDFPPDYRVIKAALLSKIWLNYKENSECEKAIGLKLKEVDLKVEGKSDDAKDWIVVIYLYQKEAKKGADGIISPDAGGVGEILLQEYKDQHKEQQSGQPLTYPESSGPPVTGPGTTPSPDAGTSLPNADIREN